MELPPPRASFASDNASGAHPDVLAALVAANDGHAPAYGADAWTARAIETIRSVFGVADAGVAFAWGGTGANVVGLQCLLSPWQAVRHRSALGEAILKRPSRACPPIRL